MKALDTKLVKMGPGHYRSEDWSIRKCPEYGNWDISKREQWGTNSDDPKVLTMIQCTDTLREAKDWIKLPDSWNC